MNSPVKHIWNDIEKYKKCNLSDDRLAISLYYSIHCAICKSKWKRLNELRLGEGISTLANYDGDYFDAIMSLFNKHYPCEDMKLRNLLE